MTIAVTNAAAVPSTKPGALSSLSGNFNNFLTLLMAQLKNQDPTAPLDTNQFTNQLVQFSSVEQQINTNTSLGKLIEMTQGSGVIQSSALIGKQVEVQAESMTLQGGKGGLKFDATGPQEVHIGVYDSTGAKLRDAVVTAQDGRNTWAWDGQDNNGRVVADGAYRTVVAAPSGTGPAQPLPFSVIGTVTEMQRKGDALNLQLGALQVGLPAVQSVRSASGS